MSKSIITSLTWVKKNWARAIPIEYEEQEETIKEYKKLQAKIKTTGNETIKETTKKLEDNINSLDINMKEVEMENLEDVPVFCDEFKNYYKKEEELSKPKTTSKNEGKSQEMADEGEEDHHIADDNQDYPMEFDEVSDDEKDDFTIHPTDALIACTTAQDDFSSIEVYIFDEINQSLYVHHDIILSAYPLCIEWLPLKNNYKANYAIVGSFLPEIEIWNLDVQDALEPEYTLGKIEQDMSDKYYKNFTKKKKTMTKAKNSADANYVHTDAVISLNINPFNSNILCSGSADSKILFWDLNGSHNKAVKSITEHTDKVQCVKWNKMEDNVLISGSFDKTIKLYDVRADNSCMTIKLNSDVECLDWSSVNKYLFLSSYENGRIELYDIRKFDTILNFQAHKKAATGVTFSNKQEGLFASISSDSHVKVWDAENLNVKEDGVYPSLVCEKFVKKSTVFLLFLLTLYLG
jgi:periodic tryptophan protein 1